MPNIDFLAAPRLRTARPLRAARPQYPDRLLKVDSHLKLLAHAGVVNSVTVQKVIDTFDEVRAITWRLLNPGK